MRTKKEIAATLSKFAQVAFYDEQSQEHLLVIFDREEEDICTIVKRKGEWSLRRWEKEASITENELVDFLWKHRAAFRQSMLLCTSRGSE
jgi:hypothetical protein